MTRHCKRCNADVEDTGGYCLLGHPLRLNMETASLDDLRKEIDEVFGSAQDEVRDALTPLIDQVEAAPAAQAPVAQPEPAMAAAVATMPARYAAPPVEPVAAPVAPSAPAQRVAPPPPPPQRQQTKFESLWESFENQETPTPLDSGDPINAFAPPPRMDWGPERSSKKGRGLRRLRVSNA